MSKEKQHGTIKMPKFIAEDIISTGVKKGLHGLFAMVATFTWLMCMSTHGYAAGEIATALEAFDDKASSIFRDIFMMILDGGGLVLLAIGIYQVVQSFRDYWSAKQRFIGIVLSVIGLLVMIFSQTIVNILIV